MEATENQDDLIIKQQREIEKEVREAGKAIENKCRLINSQLIFVSVL